MEAPVNDKLFSVKLSTPFSSPREQYLQVFQRTSGGNVCWKKHMAVILEAVHGIHVDINV